MERHLSPDLRYRAANPAIGGQQPGGPASFDDWIESHRDCGHGPHCSCRLLAAATGAAPSSIDFRFCVTVLQKRWRMTCDHFPAAPRKILTPRLPPHDSHDPVHLTLIANADFGTDNDA